MEFQSCFRIAESFVDMTMRYEYNFDVNRRLGLKPRKGVVDDIRYQKFLDKTIFLPLMHFSFGFWNKIIYKFSRDGNPFRFKL